MSKLTTIVVLSTFLFWHCQSHSKPEKLSLEEKKKQVEKLRKELFRLQSQIAELEQAIQAEDSTYGLGKQVSVGYTVLQPQPFIAYLQFQGAVDNRQVVNLTGKIAAPVVAIYVQEGQQVAAHQLLLEQEAEVIRKNLTELRTRLELARTLYEKQKKLYEEGIGSEVQYLTAKNNKEALEASIATVEEQLRNAQIRAPFAGKVDAVLARPGELLAPGAPAFRLISSGQWEIKSEIPESYLSLVRPGQEVEIHIPDLASTFRSRIATISENISPLSRTFTIVIREIPTSYKNQLRPNLIAYVRIPEKQLPQALVVPTEAIQFQDSVAFVYVYRSGAAYRKQVKIAATRGGITAVTGVNAGDTVLTTGASLLSEGQRVLLSSVEGL
ncbi:MAG: efflux RND transporter periplasmic adaptor subunit [Bacteroidia bacterium]|nr:efflux RND transporter periplasmic adaptor subunit [Bacteroidia bacterium]